MFIINMSCREVAQLGRAPGSGPGGRGFKSRLPDRAYLVILIYGNILGKVP
jgi:hypothetical protein